MEWVVGFPNTLAKLMKFELIFGKKNEKMNKILFFLFLDEFFVKAIKLSLLPTYFGFQVNKHVSFEKKGKIHFFLPPGGTLT